MPPVIAKCRRCGRGFVWLRADSDMIDHYRPPRVQAAFNHKRMVPMFEGEECGGAIEMVSSDTAESQTESHPKRFGA